MSEHSLHLEVAKAFDATKKSFQLLTDPACGGTQQLPFFISVNPHNETCVANVDLMIVEKDRVRLVCEIEESGFIPTKIYGKVFSTASAIMSKINNSEKFDVDYNGIFVQVVSTTSFNEDKTKKIAQFKRIESLINDILKRAGLWIKEYHLILGKVSDFEPNGTGYIEIEKIINKL